MIGFEEAFGRPPEQAFDGPDLFARPAAAADDDEDEDDDDAGAGAPPPPAADDGTPPPAPPAEGGTPLEGGAGAAALAEYQQEMVARGFQPDDYSERGWKTYRELETRFSQRPPEQQPAPPAPAAEPTPPPRPLGGTVSTIETEEQLYSEAQTRPRETAYWALENRERLSEEQFDNVMNLWFVNNPYEFLRFQMGSFAEGFGGQIREEFQHETAAQFEQARAEGLQTAYDDEIVGPLLQQYRPQLSQYMRDNPHLNDWVNGLRTAPQVKQAVEAVFFMMAGPELAKEVTAARGRQAAAAGEPPPPPAGTPPAAEPPDPAAAAGSVRRSAAPRTAGQGQMNDDDYAKGIQDRILNPSRKRDAEGRFV